MPEDRCHSTILVVSWRDLLDFGMDYEHFTDLLADAICDDQGIDPDRGLLITDYGFAAVEDPGHVSICVEYEIEDEWLEPLPEDEPVYQLTPKGKLVAKLMAEGLSYEAASRIVSDLNFVVVD